MSDIPTTPVEDPAAAAEPTEVLNAAPVAATGEPVSAAAPAAAPEPVATESAAPGIAPAEPAEPASAQAAAPAPVIPELSPAACAARLAELFPAVFSPGAAQPLKLRIQADVQQRAPGIFTKKSLSIFLHRHTTSTAYLKALTSAAARVDLDGAAAGDVAEEHRQAAGAELERRRAMHDARRQAERDAQREAQREAHRKAQEAARREHAADEDGRRDRANLLRAFEATTLTRANFCALKALPEAQLDALLAQARQEREQRALAPADDRGHDRRDDRRDPRQAARPDPRQQPRQAPGQAPRNEGRGPRPAQAGRPGGRPAPAPKPTR